MDNIRIAKALLKIATEMAGQVPLDTKLASLKTKQAVINYFYRLVGDMPGMHERVSDDGWGHVHDVFNKIRSSGVDLTVSTNRDEGGDYWYGDTVSLLNPEEQAKAMSLGGKLVGGKKWILTIEFDGFAGKHWVLKGYLNASFVNQGFFDSPYEITFYLS